MGFEDSNNLEIFWITKKVFKILERKTILNWNCSSCVHMDSNFIGFYQMERPPFLPLDAKPLFSVYLVILLRV
jgi:hypothetical protein